VEVCGSGSALLARTAYEAFISRDAGRDWTAISSPNSRDAHVEPRPGALFCLDAGHLWVAYTDGAVLRSISGGNWSQAGTIPQNVGGFSKIDFVASETGVGLVNGKLWLTRDGGITWKQLSINTEVIDFSIGKNHEIDLITPSSLMQIQF